MIKRAIICFLVLLTTGCYRMSYKFSLDQGKTHRSAYWNHYFFYGLAPVKERYSFDELCYDSAVTRIDTKISGANALSAFLSLGTSTANTISAECLVKPAVKK